MTGERTPLSATALSPRKQLAFALLLFERMLPSLIAFSKDTGRDDSCYLRAREAAWSALQNGGAVDQAVNQACLSAAPHTEDFSHKLTSQALNAALTMSEIVEFTLDSNPDHTAYISTLAHDSVYLYLSSLEPAVVTTHEKNTRIASNPLMLQEQRREEGDIRFLSELPDQLDKHAISAIRARASTQPPLLPPAH